MGDLRRALDVVAGASSQLAEDQLLGDATAHQDGDGVVGEAAVEAEPVLQGELLGLAQHRLAAQIGLTPSQLALAWVLRRKGVIAIPKTSSRKHLEENVRAGEVTLAPEIEAELDRLFPPPAAPSPLEML